MLNKRIKKQTAALWTIGVFTSLILVLIWPIRFFQEDLSFYGGDVQAQSELVDYDHDAGFYFTAQYDHLQTVTFHISDIEEGAACLVQLFHMDDYGVFQCDAYEYASLIDDSQKGEAVQQIPGPDDEITVTVSLDVDIEPGEQYVLIIRGSDSTFRVGLTDLVSALLTGESPSYLNGFYTDTTLENGMTIATNFVYRIPLRKEGSILLAAKTLVLAAIAVALTLIICRLLYGKGGGTNLRAQKKLAREKAAAKAAPAPSRSSIPFLRRRKEDNVPERLDREKNFAYASGRVKTKEAEKEKEEVVEEEETYRVDHSTTTVLNAMRAVLTPIVVVGGLAAAYLVGPLHIFDSRWRDILIFEIGIAAAMLIALYGLWHSRAKIERFVEPIYGSFKREWNHYGIIAAMAIMFGYSFYYMNATYEEMHTISQKGLIISGAVMTALMLNHNGSGKIGKEKTKMKVCWWLLIPLAVFFLMFILNRNGRDWVWIMGICWGVFFVRFAFWKDKKLWLRDVCTGICVNFIAVVFWTLFRRYYNAYILSRFGMQFFTVTVTGYYLVMVAGAVLTLLFMKYERVQEEPFWVRLAYTWKEWVLFGVVMSYTLMTLTRSSYAGTVVIIFLSLCISNGRHLKKFFRMAGAMILAVIICFPMIFTGQRTIPAVVQRPFIFDYELDYTNEALLRNTPINSTKFMNIEIFIRDFGDRIIGGDVGSNWYYGNDMNIPQGEAVSENTEEVPKIDFTKLADLLDTESSSNLLLLTDSVSADEEANTLDAGDYSNGRKEIWKAYLAGISMEGHEVMGAELPDGSTAAHAHNIVLQMMWDCGIPTGCLFALVLILALIRAVQYRKHHKRLYSRGSYPLLMMVGFLVVGLVEWTFQLCNPYTLALMMVMAPLLFENVVIVRVRRKRTIQ